MSRTSRTTHILIAAGLAVLGSPAAAQTFPTATDCTTSLTDSNCFHLKGSDTLFDIMTTAINNARTAGVPGAKNLYYEGSGSGNAETQLKANNGSGAIATGASIPLGVQSIGPMSRNFRPAVIDGSSVGFAQADGSTAAKKGHTSWAPSVPNVIGLDAAVVVVKSNATCRNVNFNTFVDSGVSEAPTRRAVTNTTTLTTAFNNNGAFNNPSSTINYDNLLMVVLSGVDGSGTLAACSDPRRVQALQDLAGCLGVNTIDHIYRRDDNSGTTDTFKDRIMVVGDAADPRYPWIGGRFCNGKAIGGIDSATPKNGLCSVSRAVCAVDSNCGTGQVCQFNLNNQDFDPIRRPCVAADGSHSPASCTNMLTGKACQPGLAENKFCSVAGTSCTADSSCPGFASGEVCADRCTQGLITALTDTDPGSDSITNSIAARVKNDASGQSIGYAGKEAVLAGKGTKGLNINTTSFSDVNVRKDSYLLSRRLFLQNANNPTWPGGQPAGDVPSDGAGPSLLLTGGGATQLAAEQNLFDWMTNPNNTTPGRVNVDSIVKQFNFITCYTDPTVDVAGVPNNLCSKTPFAPVSGAKGAYVPSGITGGTAGAPTINSQGAQWNGTAAAQITGQTAGTLCIGGTVAADGNCPLATGRLPNAACSQNGDCASNACSDVLGLGSAGVPAYWVCQ
jgi:hypothetical protein